MPRSVASWDDLRRIALALPETDEAWLARAPKRLVEAYLS